MKKTFLLLICLLVCCVAAFSQSVTLTFTAKDVANHYVQLNRVTITNLTKSWQETIYWPDTTLTMQNGTGIADVETCHGASLQLSQNNPNPFTGTTEVSLMVAEEDEVMLDIADVNGKTVGTNRMRPQAGIHQFRVTLSTSGTYIMTARQNGQTSSIKMVCNGGGDGNRIEYTGNGGDASHASATQSKNGPKYTTTHPFNFGDQMEYVGYATINGSEAESQRISQPQGASQTFTLQFAETQHQLPTVTTNAVSNITYTSAMVGGSVISDGGATVFDRGVCYSTNPMPTVSDICVHIGQGTGTFSGNLTGLSENTTYYVRAFAINNVGVAYGNEESFTTTSTLSVMVTTDSVICISYSTATCGGNVIYNGEENILVRGVCWNTSPNPNVNHNHTTDGGGVGYFTSQLTGLNPGTTYYIRAYATSVLGTVYGSEVNFTTNATIDAQPCPGAATVTDIDGNSYNTVQIGNQCWMKENLRTTRYANGTTIPLGTITSTITPYRYSPGLDTSNVPIYGYLYNWPAVMRGPSSSLVNPNDVQGICPMGWHVPSHAEWMQLIDYVSCVPLYQCNGYSDYIAKALASTTGWHSYYITTCAVGNTPSTNNATGFSALPAGYYYGYPFDCIGLYAQFWIATEYNCYDAYNSCVVHCAADVTLSTITKYSGYSVRCVHNEGESYTGQLPTVSTFVVNNITTSAATCGGNVTATGTAAVTARGICWSTSQNPTISDNHTSNGSGTGSFTSSITGLTSATTYYVRAYATNSIGTAYGEVLTFTTPNPYDGQPCTGAPTVTDYDNNTYNTVQIGAQCWMKENLRTTHYSNGTSIALGNDTSTTIAYRYYPNNNSSNVSTYGYLYNWKAVMRNSSSSSANPSGVQGICPVGWHVPSDAEWWQLTYYVSSQTQYLCYIYNSNYIAKALASTMGWDSSTETCDVGNNPGTNNATGFSALPAGVYDGNYYNFGYNAYFWSATEGNDNYAYGRYLYYDYADVDRYNNGKGYGFSVRCVRD